MVPQCVGFGGMQTNVHTGFSEPMESPSTTVCQISQTLGCYSDICIATWYCSSSIVIINIEENYVIFKVTSCSLLFNVGAEGFVRLIGYATCEQVYSFNICNYMFKVKSDTPKPGTKTTPT